MAERKRLTKRKRKGKVNRWSGNQISGGDPDPIVAFERGRRERERSKREWEVEEIYRDAAFFLKEMRKKLGTRFPAVRFLLPSSLSFLFLGLFDPIRSAFFCILFGDILKIFDGSCVSTCRFSYYCFGNPNSCDKTGVWVFNWWSRGLFDGLELIDRRKCYVMVVIWYRNADLAIRVGGQFKPI